MPAQPTPNAVEPELREASIVALGKFNPAIFQPQWYSANGLIRAEEAEKAEVGVIHNDFTVFSTEWFRVEITQERFFLFTADPTKNMPLRDLCVGTFKILEHTPITAFGLNSNQEFLMATREEWHEFGHYYAPKKSWSNVLVDAGLRVMIMEGTRQNSDAKRIAVRLEPSNRLKPQGVRISVNEHYDLDPNATPQDRMRTFLNKVEAAWEPFLSYADQTSQHLLREAKAVENENG